MERYNEKYNSKDRLIHAKIELMTFGWWNCANHEIKRVNEDGTTEEEFNEKFLKLGLVSGILRQVPGFSRVALQIVEGVRDSGWRIPGCIP